MTLLILLGLAALWAVVLLPPLLRARTDRSADSIGDFNYRLGVLGQTNGAAPTNTRPSTAAPSANVPLPPVYAAPMTASERAAKRRRDVVRILVAAVTITFVAAYFTGVPALWALQVVTDVLLVAYFALWAWVRQVQTEQVEKVRYLPQKQRAPELALRRTGSS